MKFKISLMTVLISKSTEYFSGTGCATFFDICLIKRGQCGRIVNNWFLHLKLAVMIIISCGGGGINFFAVVFGTGLDYENLFRCHNKKNVKTKVRNILVPKLIFKFAADPTISAQKVQSNLGFRTFRSSNNSVFDQTI